MNVKTNTTPISKKDESLSKSPQCVSPVPDAATSSETELNQVNLANISSTKIETKEQKPKLQRSDSKPKKNIISNVTSLTKSKKIIEDDNKPIDNIPKNKQSSIIKKGNEKKPTSVSNLTLTTKNLSASKAKQNENSAVSKNLKAEESPLGFNTYSKTHNKVQCVSAQAALNQPVPAETMTILPRQNDNQKPPLPRQSSSQDDKSLNDKVEKIRINHENINEKIKKIRQDHEKRVNKKLTNVDSSLLKPQNQYEIKNKITKNPKSYVNEQINKSDYIKSNTLTSFAKKKEETEEEETNDETTKSNSRSPSIINIPTILNEKKLEKIESRGRQKFKILYRSASSRPISKDLLKINEKNEIEKKKEKKQSNIVFKINTEKNNNENFLINDTQSIPISFYPNNSCNYEIISNKRRLSRSNTNPNVILDVLKPSENINIPPSHNTKNFLTTKFNGPSPRVLQLLAERKETMSRLKEEALNNMEKSNISKKIIPHQNSEENVNLKPPSTAPTRRSRWSTSIEDSSESESSKSTHRKSSIVSNRGISTESTDTSKRRGSHRQLTKNFSFTTFNEPLIDYESKKKPKYVIGKRGTDPGDMNWYNFF